MQKILGQTPELKKGKKGSEELSYGITKKHFTEMLEGEGVTKEMQQTVRKANRNIVFAAMEATGKEMLKTGKDVKVKLGTGAGSMVCKTLVSRESRIPSTGETKTSYAPFQCRLEMPTPGDVDFNAARDVIVESAEKKYSKKK